MGGTGAIPRGVEPENAAHTIPESALRKVADRKSLTIRCVRYSRRPLEAPRRRARLKHAEDAMATLYSTYKGVTTPVKVTHRSMKRMKATVGNDAQIRLSIPYGTSLQEAQRYLDQISEWVYTTRQKRLAVANLWDKPGIPASIPLWGKMVPSATALARVSPQYRPKTAHPSREEFWYSIDRLYFAEIKKALPSVAGLYERKLGVRARRWSIRNMRTRWGSCTVTKRTIRLNIKLAAYPPECFEYVVAHELVHILERDHGKGFHRRLDGIQPDNRARRKLLNSAAAHTIARNYGRTAALKIDFGDDLPAFENWTTLWDSHM